MCWVFCYKNLEYLEYAATPVYQILLGSEVSGTSWRGGVVEAGRGIALLVPLWPALISQADLHHLLHLSPKTAPGSYLMDAV